MSRAKVLIAVAIALFSVPALPALAHAKAPSVACGSVITRSIRLTTDLIGCAGNGLEVGAPNITIDLNGHTIAGNGVFVSGSGVYNDSFRGVTVSNGRIRDFSRGAQSYAAPGSRFVELDVRQTLEGISVEESARIVVAWSTLQDNRTGLYLLGTRDAIVHHNVVTGNETEGASDTTSTGNRYSSNIFHDSGFEGLDLESAHDAVVERNWFVANGIEGFRSIAGDRTLVEHNVAVGNDGDGLAADGAGSTFRRNLALRNAQAGIRAEADAIDGGGNVAAGNGETGCVHLRCR